MIYATVMTWIYRIIALLIFIVTMKEFWSDKVPSNKVNACMVMVPLAIRILMIK